MLFRSILQRLSISSCHSSSISLPCKTGSHRRPDPRACSDDEAHWPLRRIVQLCSPSSGGRNDAAFSIFVNVVLMFSLGSLQERTVRHDGMVIAISLTVIVHVCIRAIIAVTIAVLPGRGGRSSIHVQQRILDASCLHAITCNRRKPTNKIIRRSSRCQHNTFALERHYFWLQQVERQGASNITDKNRILGTKAQSIAIDYRPDFVWPSRRSRHRIGVEFT